MKIILLIYEYVDENHYNYDNRATMLRTCKAPFKISLELGHEKISMFFKKILRMLFLFRNALFYPCPTAEFQFLGVFVLSYYTLQVEYFRYFN